jgi:hypothetical protein
MKHNYFTELNQLDVSNHIEKKGQFNYISWAWIQETLGKLHPEAIITVKTFDNGLPVNYYPHDGGAYVWVTITINDVERGRPYPVLNHQNKPISCPNAFDINTAIQRAFVKSACEHGIGLFVFAGEDLPTDAPPFTKEEKAIFDTLLESDDDLAYWYYMQTVPRETQTALFNSFPKGQITVRKNLAREKEKAGSHIFMALRDAMAEHIEQSDTSGLEEIGNELGEAKAMAFHQLPADLQEKAKEIMQ